MNVYVVRDNEGNVYSAHSSWEKARQAIFKYYPLWETTQRLQYNAMRIEILSLDELYKETEE